MQRQFAREANTGEALGTHIKNFWPMWRPPKYLTRYMFIKTWYWTQLTVAL